ncbi:hypothetical protein D3C72_401980 [compost metagenome]
MFVLFKEFREAYFANYFSKSKMVTTENDFFLKNNISGNEDNLSQIKTDLRYLPEASFCIFDFNEHETVVQPYFHKALKEFSII